jgi:hypothetical protein
MNLRQTYDTTCDKLMTSKYDITMTNAVPLHKIKMKISTSDFNELEAIIK